ncbi:MAG: glycosyltransferase family 2 protein [Vulcanimicrobiota bacterium]
MRVNITIPTYNRERYLGRAIEGALAQSYHDFTVTVVDDGSGDGTSRLAARYASERNFCYIKLGRNVGTAQAKNVGLALSNYDAITFHDSDDIPDRHKLLIQSRALEMTGQVADPILDWESIGVVPGSQLTVEVAFTAHRLIKGDGSSYTINKRVSLVDDFLPNTQFPSQTPGDWILVNSALFRKSVFQRLGGYLDSIEEDREIRNRVLASGCITFFVDEPLVDKIEMADSLTVADDTNYVANRRCDDRKVVWQRARLYRELLLAEDKAAFDWERVVVPIDLSGVIIEEVSRPELLRLNTDIPGVSRQLAWPAYGGNGHNGKTNGKTRRRAVVSLP